MKTKEGILKEKCELHRKNWLTGLPHIHYDAIFEAMEEYAREMAIEEHLNDIYQLESNLLDIPHTKEEKAFAKREIKNHKMRIKDLKSTLHRRMHLTIKTAQFGETNGFFETLKDIEDVVRKKGEYHKDSKLRIVHDGNFLLPISYPVSNYFKMNDVVTVVELGDDV